MKVSLILFFLSLQSLLFGQIERTELDTVLIMKNESKIGYRIYKRILLPRAGLYSFNPQKANHQDSLIMEIDTLKSYYFKVLNNNGKVKMEGERARFTEHFSGDVKFYNHKGGLKRIEHWEPYYAKDSLDSTYFMDDGPTITSIKKYRKGKLKKEIVYELWIDSVSFEKYKFRKTIKKTEPNKK